MAKASTEKSAESELLDLQCDLDTTKASLAQVMPRLARSFLWRPINILVKKQLVLNDSAYMTLFQLRSSKASLIPLFSAPCVETSEKRKEALELFRKHAHQG